MSERRGKEKVNLVLATSSFLGHGLTVHMDLLPHQVSFSFLACSESLSGSVEANQEDQRGPHRQTARPCGEGESRSKKG